MFFLKVTINACCLYHQGWSVYTHESTQKSILPLCRGTFWRTGTRVGWTIPKNNMHLDLWLPQTHDPPQEEPDCITIHIQPHRSYEWWEAINHVSGNEYYEDTFVQSPYEDEYSQLEPCEYWVSIFSLLKLFPDYSLLQGLFYHVEILFIFRIN